MLVIAQAAALALALVPSEPEPADQPRLRMRAEIGGVALGGYALDEVQTPSERSRALSARLRLGAELTLGRWLLQGEVDVIEGQVAGDLSRVGTVRGTDTFRVRRDRYDGLYGFAPRVLSVRLDTPYGRLLLGQTTSDWGLGVVANSGRDPEGFGAAAGGSIVDRIGFGTKPFRALETLPKVLQDTVVGLSADLVFRDDNAFLPDGDLAVGGGLFLRAESEALTFGVLQSIRLQRDRADLTDPGGVPRQLRASVTDAFVRVRPLGARDDWNLALSAEGATVQGWTDRPSFEATASGGAAISSVGAVLRAEVAHADDLLLRLELGLASGDSDSYDARVQSFAFSSAYRVGLILFQEVLPMRTARMVDRVADPGLVGTAAPGLRFAVNQGAVSNAAYLYPTLRVRVAPSTELRLGWLAAASPAGLTDLYQSARAGGWARGPSGRAVGPSWLGQEALAGLRLHFPLELISVDAELDGSIFIPGPELAQTGVGPIGLGRVALSISR